MERQAGKAPWRDLLLIAGLSAVFLFGLWAGDKLNAWPLRILGSAGGLALALLVARRLLRRPVVKQPTRTAWVRMGLFLAATLLVGLVFSVLYLSYTRAMAFIHPQRTVAEKTPASVGISGYRDVTITTEDGLALAGWYIPPQNGGMVVYSNGHGSNRSTFLYHAALLREYGYGGLLFDMRNTGDSGGTLTTMGYYESRDVVAAVRFAQSQPEVDPGRIALMGQSMGGSAQLMALPRLPEIQGVLIECSFSTLPENIAASVEGLGLPEHPFGDLVSYFGERATGLDLDTVRPVDSLANFHKPVLIIHGEQDSFLPVRNAYALYAAANEPKELHIVPEGSHCGFENVEPEEYPRWLVEFFTGVLK